MADIFISYKREERPRIAELAADLEAEGFTVWWDPELEIGVSYSKDIAENLLAAKAVVVAWSKASIDSEWVQEEASKGKERRILAPVLLERVEPPLGFTMLQTADLSSRQPHDNTHLEWRRLIGRLNALVGQAPAGPRPQALPPAPQRHSTRRGVLAAGIALAALSGAGGGFWWFQHGTRRLPASFEGKWTVGSDKPWGFLMDFKQSGPNVFGTYEIDVNGVAGRIIGTVIGSRFTFTWDQDGGYAGNGFLLLSDDGNSFSGGYTVTKGLETLTPDLHQGQWNGRRSGT